MVATGQPSTVIAAVLLTVLMVSFRPFQPSGAQLAGDGGDIVNQLGFGALGGIAVVSLLMLLQMLLWGLIHVVREPKTQA